MKKTRLHIIIIIVAAIFNSCDIIKAYKSALAMKDCQYSYQSINDITIGGINTSKGLTLLDMPQVLSLLNNAKNSIPISFCININVHNPNTVEAGFEKIDYIITINDIDFTSGQIDTAFYVAPGQTQTMPLNLRFDLSTLLQKENVNSVMDIAKSLLGLNNDQLNVNLRIKPTIKIGNQAISSPNYISIPFSIKNK